MSAFCFGFPRNGIVSVIIMETTMSEFYDCVPLQLIEFVSLFFFLIDIKVGRQHLASFNYIFGLHVPLLVSQLIMNAITFTNTGIQTELLGQSHSIFCSLNINNIVLWNG